MSATETTEQTEEATTKRFSFTIQGDVYDGLRAIARREGRSLSEVVRNSVTLGKIMSDTVHNGGRILIEEKNGEKREIIFR